MSIQHNNNRNTWSGGRFRAGLRDSAIKFCQDSTLHGLKNLAKDMLAPGQTKYAIVRNIYSHF